MIILCFKNDSCDGYFLLYLSNATDGCVLEMQLNAPPQEGHCNYGENFHHALVNTHRIINSSALLEEMKKKNVVATYVWYRSPTQICDLKKIIIEDKDLLKQHGLEWFPHIIEDLNQNYFAWLGAGERYDMIFFCNGDNAVVTMPSAVYREKNNTFRLHDLKNFNIQYNPAANAQSIMFDMQLIQARYNH